MAYQQKLKVRAAALQRRGWSRQQIMYLAVRIWLVQIEATAEEIADFEEQIVRNPQILESFMRNAMAAEVLP